MFKSINNKLLSNYPLLWNTRIVYMLPAALIIHVLFYLAGYLYPVAIVDLWRYNFFNIEAETTFSILITTLMVILWLVYYLRNNPFKSFYTLGRNYLFAEFMLIFTVFFCTATFFLTYQQGLYDNVKRKTADVDLVAEANLINLSHHFIAFSQHEFDVRNCCDSLEARRVRDSIRRAQQNQLPNSYQNYTYETEPTYITDDTTTYEKSYLHYCEQFINFYEGENYPLRTAEEQNQIGVRWLKEGKKDSVLKVLEGLAGLLKKYGVYHGFNIQEQVKEVFNDERFTVRQVLSQHRDRSDFGPEVYFINISDLSSAMHRIHTARTGFWNSLTWIILLYYTLGMTIILFSFRITRLKHWFIGIIGVGLWAILIALIVITSRMDDDNVPYLLHIIWIMLLFLALVLIKERSSKLLAGVMFNWVLWYAPFVIPLIFALIDHALRPDCYGFTAESGYLTPCPPDPPLRIWIRDNWGTINAANMLVLIATVYLGFIPMARRWQSNPEE